MPDRLAFAATWWGEEAVICRVGEGRLGASVEEQFGKFSTWTEANHFARCLNEGLDISSGEARYLATAAVLATAEVLAAASSHGNRLARRKRRPLPIAVWSLLIRLRLAKTFCCVAQNIPSARAEHGRALARRALSDAIAMLQQCAFSRRSLSSLIFEMNSLTEALHRLKRPRFRLYSGRGCR